MARHTATVAYSMHPITHKSTIFTRQSTCHRLFLRLLHEAGVLALTVAGLLASLPALAVTALTEISDVAASGLHTCALTRQGGVKCWGSNYFGQLGDGSHDDRLTPVDVTGLRSGVAAIAAGRFQFSANTCALTVAGQVKCWGRNESGQLGDNSTTDRSTPVDVAGLGIGATAIAVGGMSDKGHTCALTMAGGVKCWGDNSEGQLGDNSTVSRIVPGDVDGLASGVTAITAGGFHNCALLVTGGVRCWGYNIWGQLGNNTTDRGLKPVNVSGLSSGVVAIAAGEYHVCVLTMAGGVKCWGDNRYYQLGDATFGNNPRHSPVNVAGLESGVAAIATGAFHTCALTTAGAMKCWGMNFFGQLGDGTKDDRSTPDDVAEMTSGVLAISAGLNHSCAVIADGRVKCWGSDERGQLGDNATTYRLRPVYVSGFVAGGKRIAAGGLHSCAVTAGGGAYCWGDNREGQLGDGTDKIRIVPVMVSGLGTGIATISASDSHSCAVTETGAAKCWGSNRFGQLGDGSTISRSTPVDVRGLESGVADIAAGDGHTCALTMAGAVKCWGRYVPAPADMVGLGGGIVAIAAGKDHTCALTAGGAVKCWGSNSDGQLGIGSRDEVFDVVGVSGLGSGVTAIAAGRYHSCAVTTAGAVTCWGSTDGQPGSVNARTVPASVAGLSAVVSAVAAGRAHSCALTAMGTVKCWGLNHYGQLGDGTQALVGMPVDVVGLGGRATAIAASNDHTCALIENGAVKCWGLNLLGELGDGTAGWRTVPASPVLVPATTVVEFHNAMLDHYFITADEGEAERIDQGSAGPGWARTGNVFKSGGEIPVCRFYGSQTPGPNSHFYTAASAECALLKELQAATPPTQKRWNYEGLDFQTTNPVSGACPANTIAVYRAYNNGFSRNVDSNHRIASISASIQEVTARGWIDEGIVMCAPQ